MLFVTREKNCILCLRERYVKAVVDRMIDCPAHPGGLVQETIRRNQTRDELRQNCERSMRDLAGTTTAAQSEHQAVMNLKANKRRREEYVVSIEYRPRRHRPLFDAEPFEDDRSVNDEMGHDHAIHE